MIYKFSVISLFFLSLSADLKALNNTDKFILNHCHSVCTGEGPSCGDCYTRGVELFNIF